MPDEAIIALIAGGIIGLVWSARQYDAASRRARALQEVTAQQQERCQQQLDCVTEQQRRAGEILDRHERLLTAAEALLKRLAMRL
jgi:hypothetical protein